ncbi:hypothetical protein ABEB36_002549 [Hypothenemus hampei]|uniref:Uncharacterized protein n=1 Tax=Hypothenemus hampei TaxID=57062 RepID=A0ABD1F653_HYPHA
MFIRHFRFHIAQRCYPYATPAGKPRGGVGFEETKVLPMKRKINERAQKATKSLKNKKNTKRDSGIVIGNGHGNEPGFRFNQQGRFLHSRAARFPSLLLIVLRTPPRGSVAFHQPGRLGSPRVALIVLEAARPSGYAHSIIPLKSKTEIALLMLDVKEEILVVKVKNEDQSTTMRNINNISQGTH